MTKLQAASLSWRAEAWPGILLVIPRVSRLSPDRDGLLPLSEFARAVSVRIGPPGSVRPIHVPLVFEPVHDHREGGVSCMHA